MKKHFFAAVLLLSAAVLLSAQNLSVSVTDRGRGTALEGVMVTLVGDQNAYYTSSAGSVLIHLPGNTQSFTLLVSYPGYEQMWMQFNPAEGSRTAENQEMAVTLQKTRRSADRSSAAAPAVGNNRRTRSKINELEISYSDLRQSAATWRLGSEWVYTMFSVGSESVSEPDFDGHGLTESDFQDMFAGAGLGLKMPLFTNMSFHIEGELITQPVGANSWDLGGLNATLQLRPLVSFFNSKLLGVYAGPTFNFDLSDVGNTHYSLSGYSGSQYSGVWVGGHLGIAFALNHRKRNR